VHSIVLFAGRAVNRKNGKCLNSRRKEIVGDKKKNDKKEETQIDYLLPCPFCGEPPTWTTEADIYFFHWRNGYVSY